MIRQHGVTSAESIVITSGDATAVENVKRLTLLVSVVQKKIYIWESNGGSLDWFGERGLRLSLFFIPIFVNRVF